MKSQIDVERVWMEELESRVLLAAAVLDLSHVQVRRGNGRRSIISDEEEEDDSLDDKATTIEEISPADKGKDDWEEDDSVEDDWDLDDDVPDWWDVSDWGV